MQIHELHIWIDEAILFLHLMRLSLQALTILAVNLLGV